MKNISREVIEMVNRHEEVMVEFTHLQYIAINSEVEVEAEVMSPEVIRKTDIEAAVEAITRAKNIEGIVAAVKAENIATEAEARVEEKHINAAVGVAARLTVAITIEINYIIAKGNSIEIR